MPPRSRSKLATKDAESASKAAGNGKKRGTESRPTSPETDVDMEASRKSEEPPKKRGRGGSAGPTATAKKTTTRAGGATAAKEPKPVKPPLNPVPEPASHPRPPRNVFIFGNGDMGQFGLGTDVLGEIVRPRLHAWFDNAIKEGLLGQEGAGLEKIYAGGMHTLAIDEVGKVWSWGINDNASLGRPTVGVPDPNNEGATFEAEQLETQPMVVQKLVDQNFRAVDISAGDSVSVALGSAGDLRAWGSFRSSDGLLGFDGKPGSPKTQFEPMTLPHLSAQKFAAVACGTDHVLALATTGHVWVWGNGQQAQLGRRIIERRKINGLAPERLALRKIVLIGTGSYHSFAVDEKGVVWAWGLNSMRQTGVSDEMGGQEDIIWQPTPVSALDPKKLGGGRRVVQISGGEHHTLFLVSDGSVYGCGRCDGAELGLADDHPATKARLGKADEMDVDAANDGAPKTVDEFVPEPVQILFPPPPTAEEPAPPLPPFTPSALTSPPINPIAHISAGTRHNLAVSRSGHVYSWGFGNQCQLGLGSDVETQPTPARVKSKAMEGWFAESCSAGGQHCVVLATKVEAESK